MRADRLDLGWMRVLHETVQRGSFSGAAATLGLTQPAVSYQIRRLEEQAGFQVLRRLHGGVDLTPEGRRLYEIARAAVDGVDALVRDQSATRRRPTVRLRTDYAFSAFWLLPRMHRFRELHPEIDIQTVATQRFARREMEEGDVAVIFGDRRDVDADIILREEVVPVCAPALLDGDRGAADLARLRLIHLDAVEAPPWFDWPAYLQANGVARERSASAGDTRFNTWSLVIQAATEGEGVALGWRGLVDSLLRSKVLVEAGPPLAAPDRGYLLVKPLKPTPQGQKLVRWLVEESAAGLSG